MAQVLRQHFELPSLPAFLTSITSACLLHYSLSLSSIFSYCILLFPFSLLSIPLPPIFQFECCGIEEPTDWRRFLVVTPGLYPHSCCKESITWEELCPDNQYFNKVGTHRVARAIVILYWWTSRYMCTNMISVSNSSDQLWGNCRVLRDTAGSRLSQWGRYIYVL